jgi:Na+/proline symporter
MRTSENREHLDHMVVGQVLMTVALLLACAVVAVCGALMSVRDEGFGEGMAAIGAGLVALLLAAAIVLLARGLGHSQEQRWVLMVVSFVALPLLPLTCLVLYVRANKRLKAAGAAVGLLTSPTVVLAETRQAFGRLRRPHRIA